VLVGPYPSLQEFSHLIFCRIVPSIPFLSLSHKIHATPAPRLNPGRIDGRRRWGCFRVGKRHGVRFTSRLLRRYVTRTEARARHCRTGSSSVGLPCTSLPGPPAALRRAWRASSWTSCGRQYCWGSKDAWTWPWKFVNEASASRHAGGH